MASTEEEKSKPAPLKTEGCGTQNLHCELSPGHPPE